MAHSSPSEVIDAYRRRLGRRFPFTVGDMSQALLLLFIVGSSVYVSFIGGPELPTLVELKTNTPTLTPSITPTASLTATITSTPTETPDPEIQCNCASPVVLVVTATAGATNTPLPSATTTVEVPPSATFTPSETPTPTATPSPTPTAILYTVQRNDTLGGIAFKYGVGMEAIQALNNLDSTMIYIGQVLQIPAP